MQDQWSFGPVHVAVASLSPLSRVGVVLLVASTFGSAHAAGVPSLEEFIVTGSARNMTGVADSSSEGTVTAKQLAARPLLRPAEALETIPGLIVTQHSGDGKANQYFLRGFNLDHGSDFATSVNGMPVNATTHAHGQGYMDLNFLIPELIGGIRYRKGFYAADDGDLAVTGSARIDYARTLTAPIADLSLGEHGYKRALLAGSTQAGEANVLAALELAANDGPWEVPENLGKRNAVLRISSGSAADGYALTASAYQADWVATEQVPQRAINSGEIGRFGTLAPTDGGKTHRYSLTAEWAALDEQGSRRANAYLVDYGLNLYSTPSGLLESQHEQADKRIVWGGQAAVSRTLNLWNSPTELTGGIQFRQDRIQKVGLYQTRNRVRVDTTREDRVTENSLGVFAEAQTKWNRWLRSTIGARWDRLSADATPVGGVFNTANGGNVESSQFSPKLGIAFGPFGTTEYYVNWGKGFHSNDARGASARVNAADGTPTDPTPLIVEASGGEIGVRTQPLPGWHSSLTYWRMQIDSEMIYVGDAGVTEPKGGSRRHGLEWSNYYSNANGWIVDGDVAISHARFTDASGGGTHIPNAIPLTASLGATYDRGGDWFGGARFRYLGEYPLEETGTHQSGAFMTANLKLGYRYDPRLQFTLDILNVFDRKANDIEYWGAACTPAEGAGCNAGDGVEGRLVHPLEPRTLRLGMRVSF